MGDVGNFLFGGSKEQQNSSNSSQQSSNSSSNQNSSNSSINAASSGSNNYQQSGGAGYNQAYAPISAAMTPALGYTAMAGNAMASLLGLPKTSFSYAQTPYAPPPPKTAAPASSTTTPAPAPETGSISDLIPNLDIDSLSSVISQLFPPSTTPAPAPTPAPTPAPAPAPTPTPAPAPAPAPTSSYSGNISGTPLGNIVRKYADLEPRAQGGPVAAGQGYVVGEHQPEVFVPKTDGYIVPQVPGMGPDGRTPPPGYGGPLHGPHDGNILPPRPQHGPVDYQAWLQNSPLVQQFAEKLPSFDFSKFTSPMEAKNAFISQYAPNGDWKAALIGLGFTPPGSNQAQVPPTQVPPAQVAPVRPPMSMPPVPEGQMHTMDMPRNTGIVPPNMMPPANMPPGRALGGPVAAGQPYVVGEHQAEQYIPSNMSALFSRSLPGSNLQSIRMDRINARAERQVNHRGPGVPGVYNPTPPASLPPTLPPTGATTPTTPAVPAAPAVPATPAQYNPTIDASSGLNSYANSAGMNFILDQGQKAISGASASNGVFNSGATGQALVQYGQNLGQTYLDNYMKYLQNYGNLGLGAASAMSGSGSVNQNNSSGGGASKSVSAGASSGQSTGTSTSTSTGSSSGTGTSSGNSKKGVVPDILGS